MDNQRSTRNPHISTFLYLRAGLQSLVIFVGVEYFCYIYSCMSSRWGGTHLGMFPSNFVKGKEDEPSKAQGKERRGKETPLPTIFYRFKERMESGVLTTTYVLCKCHGKCLYCVRGTEPTEKKERRRKIENRWARRSGTISHLLILHGILHCLSIYPSLYGNRLRSMVL